MAETDAIESMTTFRRGREGRGQRGEVAGAILFDRTHMRQAAPEWFDPAHWGARAQRVSAGGRGGAWYVDAPFGAAVLRHYLRGGLAARVSRNRYAWLGEARTRSFAEYRVTGALLRQGLPVPRPLAASYERRGATYRAAILLERLQGVRTFAHCVQSATGQAPWSAAGALVARFHRAGLDHADLNAHNLLFDEAGRGWMIDFDRARLRGPGDTWRHNNLSRLLRSLHKLRGDRTRADVERDFARLQTAYENAMETQP